MKKIRVGAVNYKFFFGDEPRRLDPNPDRISGWLWGETDNREHTIRVYKHPTDKDITAQTFYHELVHAILFEYHIKNMRDEDNSHNEDAVDLLGTALKVSLESLGVDILSHLKDKK
jgi:hypothetical protein